MPSKQTRNVLAISVGMAFTALAAAAHADGPYYPYGGTYVPPPQHFTWGGFHLGFNIGAAWADDKLTDNLTGAKLESDRTGFIGGGQVGYNIQVDNLVLGVVWDFDWTSIDSSKGVVVPGIGTLQSSTDTSWVTTLAARAGVAYERGLFYLKAGGGWAHSSASITNLTTGAVVSASDTDGVWLVGGGIEYAFVRNWVARVEYDFLGLPEKTGTGPLGNTMTFNRDIQILKVGLSYKF
jgi:outer membrane immunogenic protein